MASVCSSGGQQRRLHEIYPLAGVCVPEQIAWVHGTNEIPSEYATEIQKVADVRLSKQSR